MEELALRDLWMVGGIILGFEVNVLVFRVRQQADPADRNFADGEGADASSATADSVPRETAAGPALSVSDFLGLTAVAVLAFGVFVLPVLGLSGLELARKAVVLGIILFFGHILSLVGHYELYTPRPRSFRYFPGQERVCVGLVGLLALAFVVGAALG